MLKWILRIADALRHTARLRSRGEQVTGRRGEDLAHRYLERSGFTVVARNYRPRSGRGEIDLIAWEGDRLVFVEVKCRSSDEFGVPDRNVDRQKRSAVLWAARDYARRADVPWDRARFDVVSVLLTEPPSLAHERDAFRASRTL